MAVFKSTKCVYPAQYEQGKTYYHTINHEFKEIWEKYCFDIPQEFNLTEFYTDAQKDYFKKRNTWAWCKTYLPKDFVLRLITESDLSYYIEHYALCYHDCDISRPHTHILIKFYRNTSYNLLVDYFHCDNISNPMNKLAECYNYLIHDSKQCRKDGKFVYPPSCRIVDDVDFWERVAELGDNKMNVDNTLSIIEDIAFNKLSRLQLAHKYGRDVVINYSKFYDYAVHVRIEEAKLNGIENTFQCTEDNSVDDYF